MMKCHFIWLISLWSLSFMLVSADEKLYEKLFSTNGFAMTPQETLDGLLQLAKNQAKTGDAKEIESLIWAKNVTSSRCSEMNVYKTYKNLAQTYSENVNIAAYIKHWMSRQNSICTTIQRELNRKAKMRNKTSKTMVVAAKS